MIRHKTAFLLAMLAALLPFGHAFALADPDTITIESANRYDDVAVAGDLFILVEYTLLYTVPPAESISQGYLGRVIDVGGAGQLASVQPYSGHDIPDLGYSRGVYGFYFPQEPTVTGTLRVTLEGNPSLIPSPAGIFTDSIAQRNASDLAQDLRAVALRLEDIWDVDLISPVFGGINRYTESGEHYFASALPNLRAVAPDMFILNSVNPQVPSRNIDSSYANEREALFDGTPIGTGFTYLGIFLNVSTTVAKFVVAMCLAVIAAFYVARHLGVNSIVWMATLQLWVMYLVIMGGFWIGIVTAPVLGILTVLALLATVSVFYLQRTNI